MIRQLIREILAEDWLGFLDRTRNIEYSSDLKDPTFDAENQKSLPNKSMAKDVKRAWAAEADHKFMKTVVTVHWFHGVDSDKKIGTLLSTSGKNEISTMGYLPDTKRIQTVWGVVGLIVKGRVTLAANSMDDIHSGYYGGGFDKVSTKYASSGVPRRATAFKSKNIYRDSPKGARVGQLNYILDRGSFKSASVHENEFIVDNWKPVGFIVCEKASTFLDYLSGVMKGTKFENTPNAMLGYDLPIYDETMTPIDRKSIEAAMTKKPK